MKVDVLSESSEQVKTQSTAKNCKTPFPGFRIVTYDFEMFRLKGKDQILFAWSGMIGNLERPIVSGRMSC